MKIAYKKKYLNGNLFLGVVWLIWFFVGFFEEKELHWIDYGWIVISTMYLGLYFYQKNYKYLTIKNGIISVNAPFGKKLNLTEIKQIKKFVGDYILKTDKEELTIDTQIIDPNSLVKLNMELEKLNMKWN